MKKKKIVFDIETAGLEFNPIIMGFPKNGARGKSNISGKLIEAAKAAGYTISQNFEMFDPEKANKITEEGRSLLSDISKIIEENGIGVSKVKTFHENIGGTIYPVTYGPNGIVIVDYPQIDYFKLYNKHKNDNITGSTDK